MSTAAVLRLRVVQLDIIFSFDPLLDFLLQDGFFGFLMIFCFSTSIVFKCVILGREEDWAVGATSKFLVFTLCVCPFIGATGVL